MSNLRKKVVKQQSRIAALNLLGTPAGSEAESDVDSDHSSVIGDSVIPHLDESTVEEDLRRCIDDLGEKRASSREVALATLNKILSHYYCGFFFDTHANAQEALLQLLLRSLRKPGTPQEAVLATKSIALVFVNQGEEDQEALYDMVLPFLKDAIKDTPSVDLKCQSIDTLAAVTFTAASTASTKGGLDYFYKILISQGDSVQLEDEPLSVNDIQSVLESTLHAYGLLYASVYGEDRGNKDDAWDEWQSSMPAHLDLLESKSKGVRVAAGENVALMYECSHTFKKSSNISSDDEEHQIADNDLSEYEELDDLIDILQRLASESSRRVNKQDRKQQKSAFRDILKSIQTGQKPKEKLKLGRQKFLFRGWKLHAIRSIVGAGLTNHFDKNELVQAVFEQGIEDSEEDKTVNTEDSGLDDDLDSDSGSILSGKSANRAKHSKKYKKA